MDTVSSRPYLPDLRRWRLPVVLVGALLGALVLLALVALIVAGAADSQQADQFLAPFRWGPGTRGTA